MNKTRRVQGTIGVLAGLIVAGSAAAGPTAVGAPLLSPQSAGSGDTGALQVELEIKSENYTLWGQAPPLTPYNNPVKNNPAQMDPVVKTRAVRLTSSSPAASPAPAKPLLVGPTLRVHPGDTLGVTLKNSLSYDVFAGDASHSMTIPHGFDVINLHTHGMHVSPQSPGDNVLLSIFPQDAPGDVIAGCAKETGAANCVIGQFAYSYAIPANHPAGTYWYHAHKHGAVSMHLADGYAGALIVEDTKNGLDSLPEVQAAKEQVLVIQQVAYGSQYPAPNGSQVGMGTADDPHPIDCLSVYGFPGDNGCNFGHSNPPAPALVNKNLSVNGQFQPSVSMKSKEVQLWRVVNGTVDKVVPMCFMPVSGAATPAPEAYVLAVDGVPLQKPGVADDARPVQITGPVVNPANGDDLLNNELLFLAAGQRLDLMVKAPAQAGVYALYEAGNQTPMKHLCNPKAQAYKGRAPLLTVTVVAPTDITPYNTSLPHQVALNKLTAPTTISAAETPALPTQGVTYNFTANTYAEREGGAAVINARVFNPMRSQRDLVLNQVDRWSVQSADDTHMFHIHINPFQLLSRGQVQYPFPVWRDTIMINCPSNLPQSACSFAGGLTGDQFSSKASGGQNGEVVQFAQKPVDFTGALVQHCHNVSHEDQGMMELVTISPAPSTGQASASPHTGGAH